MSEAGPDGTPCAVANGINSLDVDKCVAWRPCLPRCTCCAQPSVPAQVRLPAARRLLHRRAHLLGLQPRAGQLQGGHLDPGPRPWCADEANRLSASRLGPPSLALAVAPSCMVSGAFRAAGDPSLLRVCTRPAPAAVQQQDPSLTRMLHRRMTHLLWAPGSCPAAANLATSSGWMQWAPSRCAMQRGRARPPGAPAR